MDKMKNVWLFSLLLFSCIITYAQETTATAGGNASGESGSISYTVGQVAYVSTESNSGSVSVGVQQAYVITENTGFSTASASVNCSVFPNPASDYLVIETDVFEKSATEYFLYNLNGQVIKRGSINSTETTVDLSNQTPAVYFIRLKTNQGFIKEFKIVKN